MKRALSTGRTLDVASSIVAVALGIGLSLALIAATGQPAGAAAHALVDGAFGGGDQVAATAARMVPLILVALGWIIAFSAGLFNVGLGGQIIAGGIVAATIALVVPLPTGVHLLVAALGGALGGLVWVGIAAALWAKRGVNEIVSTLLMIFIAALVLAWVVRNPLKAPDQPSPRTSVFPDSARWPDLVEATGLNWDVIVVGAMIALLGLTLGRTSFGLALRLTAANELAARSAGMATTKIRVLALLWSGALAGLAGSSLVLGGQSRVIGDGFNSTFGFDGIAVALVAHNSPWATIPAALLFAALRQGGGLLEARLGVSSSVVLINQGIVIAVVAGSALLSRRLRARRVDAEPGAPDRASLAAARLVPESEG